MDAKRLSDWATSAEALRKFLAGLAPVLIFIWAESTKDIASLAQSLGLPAWAPRAVAALVIAGFAWVLFRSFRRFTRASRLEQPDAFTLRQPELRR